MQNTASLLYRAGIDIGSTTVKLVVLADGGEQLYGRYQRHHARTREALTELLQDAQGRLGDCLLSVCLTGSGALGLSRSLSLPFRQEAVAVAEAIEACTRGRMWRSSSAARTRKSSISAAASTRG